MKDNTSGALNRGIIADLPFLRTLLEITSFVIIPEKLDVWYIFGPFLSKNFRRKLLPKTLFVSIFSLYATPLHAKTQKSSMYWLLIIPGNPHLGPILGCFWPLNFKIKLFLKNNLSVFMSLHCSNVIHKIRKIVFRLLTILEKLHLGPISGHF